MNNADLYKSFCFNLYQFQNAHSVDNTKGNGIHANYVAKMMYGNGIIKTKNTTLHLTEGDIFFIPKGLKYQSFWSTNANNQLSWYSFGFDAFPSVEPYRLPVQKIQCDAKSMKLLDELCEDISVTCSSIGLLYQFLGEASKYMLKVCHPYSLITEKALEFMKNTDEFTMKDVAAHCEISESGLYPIFQKVFQKTPLGMKQEILCEKAVQLLTTTDMSVEEISNRLLFSSSSYFRKILRKYKNKTPREIRKETLL